MDDIAADQSTSTAHLSDLVDVTAMWLPDLISSDEPQLAASTSRVLRNIQAPHQIMAAWSNHLA